MKKFLLFVIIQISFLLIFTDITAQTISLSSNYPGAVTIYKTPTFKWDGDGVGTLNYTLYIDASPNPFNDGDSYNVGTHENYTLSSDLETGKTYYWGVEVSDANDTTQSAVRSFTLVNKNHGGVIESESSIISSEDLDYLHTVDLDNDGDQDVISTSSNNIYWYENDGSGNFTKKSISAPYNLSDCITTADLDNDGDIDIIGSYHYENEIIWFENDGSQNFTIHTIYSCERSASDISIKDIDNDGDLDIVSALKYTQIAWYENDGSENFSEHVISDNDHKSYVHTADMDNDGHKDIIASIKNIDDKALIIYKNDGNESFITDTISKTAGGNGGKIYTADIDGDGNLDILPNGEAAWYENDEDGNFIKHQIHSYYLKNFYPSDFNGDGHVDILVGLHSPTKEDIIAWYENTGGGNLIKRNIISVNDEPYNLRAADLDNDGDMDILRRSDGIAWHKNNTPDATITLKTPQDEQGIINKKPTFTWGSNGTGELAHTLYIDTDPDPYNGGNSYNAFNGENYTPNNELTPGKIYYWGVEVTDENGTTQSIVQSFSVINTNQGGLIGSGKNITTSANNARSVHSADLNGNGKVDVISASNEEGMVRWHENDGSGSFTSHVIDSNMSKANIVHAVDINGEGYIDVIACSEYGEIKWYQNNGSGNFTKNEISTSLSLSPLSIYPADMNSDGNMDFIIGGSSSNGNIIWLENDGSENFTGRIIDNSVSNVYDFHSADIDNDGDKDLLAAHYSKDRIVWYENLGGKSFKRHTIHEETWATSVYATDIDNDGDMDVVSSFTGGDLIAWHENDGSGHFTMHEIYTESGWHWNIYSTDINGDGNKDVLSATRKNGEINWYKNDGEGNFITNKITGLQSPRKIHAADIDNDGDMDILVALKESNRITWYENYTLHFTKHPESKTVFFNSNATFSISDKGAETYQWQVDKNKGFSDLTDNAIYSGTDSKTLTINNCQCDISGYKYRCKISNEGGDRYSDPASLGIKDTISPVLTPRDTTIHLDNNGSAEITSSDVIDNVFDNCTLDNISISHAKFSCNETGDNTIKIDVTDTSDNVTSKFSTVTVKDTITPSLTTTNPTIVIEDGQNTLLNPDDVVENVSDNCSISDTTISKTIFNCNDLGTVYIDVTVTDKNGNSKTKTSTVTVKDNVAPTLITKDVKILLNADGETSITAADVIEKASDNCTLTDSALSQTTFDCSDLWDYNVDINVNITDNSGNTTTKAATVKIRDTISPTISVKDTSLALNDNGFLNAEASDFVKFKNDNCWIYKTEIKGNNSFNCSYSDSSINVKIISEDGVGNTKTKIATLTVTDTTSPTLTTKNATLHLDEDGEVQVKKNEVVETVSDNCGNTDIIFSKSLFNSDDIGENTIEVTADDNNGNLTSETTIVTVKSATSLNDFKQANIKVYPNPTTGKINLTFSRHNKIKIVNLMDLTGRIIKTTTNPDSKESFDLSSFKNGIYILQIQTTKNTLNTKILKTNE